MWLTSLVSPLLPQRPGTRGARAGGRILRLSGISNNGRRLRTFLSIFLPLQVLFMAGATPVGIAVGFLLSVLANNEGASCISALAAGASLCPCLPSSGSCTCICNT